MRASWSRPWRGRVPRRGSWDRPVERGAQVEHRVHARRCRGSALTARATWTSPTLACGTANHTQWHHTRTRSKRLIVLRIGEARSGGGPSAAHRGRERDRSRSGSRSGPARPAPRGRRWASHTRPGRPTCSAPTAPTSRAAAARCRDGQRRDARAEAPSTAARGSSTRRRRTGAADPRGDQGPAPALMARDARNGRQYKPRGEVTAQNGRSRTTFRRSPSRRGRRRPRPRGDGRRAGQPPDL